MKLTFKVRQYDGSWYVNAYFRGKIVMTSAWERRYATKQAAEAWCALVGIKVAG